MSFQYGSIATGSQSSGFQGTPPSSTTPCRFRLDNESSGKLILPDGRTLGYAEYGSKTGQTIFYCHGMPGSRLELASWDELAKQYGARMIAIERPSYGWSSPQPSRKLLDHPKDIQHLADHLGVASYGVMGLSGGGTYALACAAGSPADKLKGVAIVAGLGPPDIGYAHQNWWHFLGFTIGFRYLPGLTRWWFSKEVPARLDLSDEKRFELMRKQFASARVHEKDLQVFQDNDFLRLFLQTARESYAQGVNAFAEDGKLITSKFGFRVEDIRSNLPIRLWYGRLDTHVPANHGEIIAQRLGDNTHVKLRVENETHASITVLRKEDILRDLLESMSSSGADEAC